MPHACEASKQKAGIAGLLLFIALANAAYFFAALPFAVGSADGMVS